MIWGINGLALASFIGFLVFTAGPMIASLGLSLHGFGLKLAAIDKCRTQLASADSMAWS